MEERLEIITNLKQIFECFLDENFITNHYICLDKLVSHLAAKDNAYILQAPFALDWVDRCINILCEDISKLNPKVISFVFNVFGLLINNEWTVIEIRERRLVDKVLEIVKRESHRFNPSIKLGVIRLLHAVSKYSIGLAYLRTMSVWQFLIEYCNQAHTLYVVREARHLLYEMLYKFDVKTKDAKVVKEILSEVFQPIMENVYDSHNESIVINVDDYELQHKLSSTLALISFILQQTLESEEKTSIAQICKTEYNIDITVWKLTEISHNENFIRKILETLSSFYFAKLVHDKWTGDQIPADNFNELCVSIFNQMKFCVSRNYCVTFLNVAEINHKLWKKLQLHNRVPKEVFIENELVRFEHQLITFQLLPLHILLRSHEFLEEEIFEKYMTKIFEIVCELTLRISYAYRDLLFNKPPTTNADLSIKAIHGAMSMVDILERDQAVLVFQACIYALKQFMITLYPHNMLDCPDDSACTLKQIPSFSVISEFSNVVHAILVAMQTLIERFKITWKDSIETICLVNCVLYLLQTDDLPTKVSVQSLKLLKLSIEHFLSPNMALLVDNLKGSALLVMAPVIMKRSHDTAWEVRDSVLELVISITDISRLKYPAFQKFLAEHWMCRIVYDMAKHDSEPYVRASALKCISELVAIDAIWELDLSKQNLPDHLFDVLNNDPEGIVRKEALSTLTKLNSFRKITSRYKDSFYSTLVNCVVNDLHWEVKVEALKAWRSEIRNLLSDEGMIDGIFPPVTFSKEKRKIVKLNEKEINLRFSKILNELSQRGCLGAILKCLNDDCDVAVIREAKSLVKKLVDKLDEYNYDCASDTKKLNNQMTSENNTDMSTRSVLSLNNNESNNNETTLNSSLSETVKLENNSVEIVSGDAETLEFLDSEEIIESILDTKDINLLAEAYEQSMHINGGSKQTTPSQHQPDDERKHIDKLFYRQFSNVNAKDFLALVRRTDFEEEICKQDEWFLCNENLASLLEDILSMFKPESNGESISADCY
ncbi:uncharacterized protein LOC105210142 [Zeugodacus cucurbitae]|uniref:BRCA1-associated ATM activator 1 n=1 Tax=Zeugodacus cucurbitae TaxID=28588 RepID=A0A0A1WED1_ZEUCU|nr:uncharacterized protein LOC105210142 [Zeugodacus cucurbitae]